MKYSIVIVTTITLIAAIALSGCENRPSDKMEKAETSVIEANRDLEIATSEVEAELKIYRAKNSDRMVEYERTIAEIKQKINNEPDLAVRARYQTRLDGYEATHSDLKREMDNYRVAGRGNWHDFRDSFSNRMDDLGRSLNNFFSTSRTNTNINQP